jgi:hypothetical protein
MLKNLPAISVKILQLLRSSLLPHWPKYKSLRSALSHQEPVPAARRELEYHFGKEYFDFTMNDEFDILLSRIY